MAAAGMVTIRNNRRDTKELGMWDDKRVVLGSVDDEGINLFMPRPEITIPQEAWKKFLGRKAVKAWLDTKEIQIITQVVH